jgi:hypothetical protein
LKFFRIGTVCLVLWLGSILLDACGADPTRTQNTSPDDSTTIIPGSKTAVAFFTPSAPATTPPTPGYILSFNFKPGNPVLDASITTPLPEGRPSDWSVVVDGDGTTKYTKNPRSKTGAVTVENYLNQEKLNSLLQQLNGLGVLAWPDTTAPDKIAAGGSARSLHLYLQGRTKAITDLSGGSGDALSMMLDLIKKTVEEAPQTKAP